MINYHKSVLVEKVVENLNVTTAALIIDATLGDGGHAYALLQAMPEDGRVIGIDLDPDALARSKQRLSQFGERFQAIEGNFGDLEALLEKHGVRNVDGVLADLGISQLQITDASKGFMYSGSGPLAMTMGNRSSLNAETVVNELSEDELARVIWKYGEERDAKRIARAIVSQRRLHRITTTDQLADIVRKTVRHRFVVKTLARVFQAIRIYVNKELESLERFLPQAENVLRSGGRLVVISYHSLEDRRVKEFFRKEANPCECPPELPQCVCGKKPRLKIINKLIRPTAEEIAHNPSARSAKMRVAEKI